MSSSSQNSPAASPNGLPTWIVTGVLGLAVGIGGAILGMTSYGYKLPDATQTDGAAGSPGSVPNPGMMNGSNMSLGAGMMGGGGPPGMMGGGMMGGGGKRALTTLVGKLELLSRNDLNLKIELTPEQSARLSELLMKLEQAEKMSGDEATEFQKSMEEILSKEQNDTLALIGLPFARPAGGGMPGGMGGMGGMAGGNADENPFTQETNQKRLQDLQTRLKPAE